MVVDGLTFEEDLAAGGFLQVEDGASQGGFAAAALPYQSEALAFVDVQRDVVDGVDDGAVAGE